MTQPLSIPTFAPAWAEVFGEDDCGIFAEFSLGGVPFVWRWIPPGRFLMGSPESEQGRWDAEGPQHPVTISRGFWLGETPVTQRQWECVMGKNPSHFKGDDRPVEQVTWHACRDFAERLNSLVPSLWAALPTEAQWEYACRAGSISAFSDGSPCTQPDGHDPALEKLGWFDGNSERQTREVKGKQHNPWGLYDLHGNVWEWCRDAWDAEIYQSRTTGVTDPLVQAAEEGADRVVRGGSWCYQARRCRSAYRPGNAPGIVWDNQGLRLSAGQEPGAADPPEGRSRGGT